MNAQLAAEQIEKYDDLAAKRDYIWKTGWQQVSGFALPNDSDIQVTKTPGQVAGWTDRIYDITMIQANQTLAAGQRNLLTPSDRPWFEMEPPDELKANQGYDNAAVWLGQASDKLRKRLAESNFSSIANIGYLSVPVFGTDYIHCEEGRKTMLNFQHWKIGTYVIEEDDSGMVDTGRRLFKMKGRQILQQFSKKGDEIPEAMMKVIKTPKGKMQEFEILHCVFPRDDSDRIPGAKDGKNKPIASVYIAKDFKDCIRVSGYDEMPGFCSRYSKWTQDDPWGYGPGYLALPLARQVNYVTKYMDSQAELHAEPRILAPDNLAGDVDLRAGGVTTYDGTAGPESVPREWLTGGDYKLGMELLAQKRDAINEMFFVPLFKMLGSEPLIDKSMTAYEVAQRLAEKAQQVTPIFDRRVTEFLQPMLQRAFGVCFRAGDFGTPPDSLMQDLGGGKKGFVMPKIVIKNSLNEALSALQNRGIEQTFTFLQPLAESHPEVYDNFKLDDSVRDYARNSGVNPDLFSDVKSRDKKRAAQAKIQQQQRATETAETLSKTGLNLAGSPQWLQDLVQQAVGGGAPTGQPALTG